MNLILTKIQNVTEEAAALGETQDYRILKTTEELGEFVVATLVERGLKQKELNEPSKMEAIDIIICALSLYFTAGGTVDDFEGCVNTKLDKWIRRINAKRISATG